ncbi:MAG TPA: serine hydrolase domain-containing protein [Pyrinomonadaceae bacterium]|nr:serine hydrolase domain-containing protein [Pyrinomonadaceae bacterium]
MLKTIALIIGVLIFLLALGFACFLAYRYYGNRNIKDTKNLEEIVGRIGDGYVSKNGNVGMVVGIVKGDRVFIKGFGKKSKESGDAPDAQTIFELASIGKVFTASAAQILSDRGEISFDDSIDKYLNPKVKLCEKAKNITLRQLATHTSGLPSFPESFVPKIKDELNPYKDLTVQDLYDYLATCENLGKAGSFDYSNLGMGVLGHILELKTGKSYETIVKDEIINWLEMKNTTITLSAEQRGLLAQGYNEQGNPNPVWEDSVLTGAGSFLSNAEDMTKFIRANFDASHSEISNFLLKTHEKQTGGETGLGWHYYSRFFAALTDEEDVIWHNGGAGGYASFIAINKKTKSGIIVLSNTTDDVTWLGTRLNFSAKNISFSDE